MSALSPDVDRAGTGPSAPERSRFWLGWRAALLVVWLVLAGTAAVAGQRESTVADLERALRDGRVDTVRLGVAPGNSLGDQPVTELGWREHGVGRHALVAEVPLGDPAAGVPEPMVVRGDVAAQLRTWQPGVRLVREEAGTSWAELWGFRLPPWAGWFTLSGALGALVLLVSGPQPWRATRWAWFWLSGNPLGALAFVLLSGPAPLLPAPRPGARRLTGGWAFLLAFLLGVLPGGPGRPGT